MRRTPASASGATRSVRPSRSRSDATAHQALRSAPSSGPASIRVTPRIHRRPARPHPTRPRPQRPRRHRRPDRRRPCGTRGGPMPARKARARCLLILSAAALAAGCRPPAPDRTLHYHDDVQLLEAHDCVVQQQIVHLSQARPFASSTTSTRRTSRWCRLAPAPRRAASAAAAPSCTALRLAAGRAQGRRRCGLRLPRGSSES